MSEPAEGFEHTATGFERMIKACGATFEFYWLLRCYLVKMFRKEHCKYRVGGIVWNNDNGR